MKGKWKLKTRMPDLKHQQQATNSVLATVESERFRIARIIHNGLLQQLTALSFEMAFLDRDLEDSKLGAPNVRQRVETLNQLVEDLIKSARKIESELRR